MITPASTLLTHDSPNRALLVIDVQNDFIPGGALAVQRSVPLVRVVGGDPDELPGQLQAQACASGERWQWDDVQFSLWQWDAAGDSNQRSCVLRVRTPAPTASRGICARSS